MNGGATKRPELARTALNMLTVTNTAAPKIRMEARVFIVALKR